MATARAVLELIDFVTTPSREGPESLAARDLTQMRRGVGQSNVVGLGLANKEVAGKPVDQLCLAVYVRRKLSLSRLRAIDAIPNAIRSLSGTAVFTDVVEFGVLKPEKNARRKPITPGYSIGHLEGDTGTLGAIVIRDREPYLLSNSHVLAMCGRAKKGDTILFPGWDDGGRKAKDSVGTLVEAVRIKTRGVNTVDAAVARLDPDRLADVVAKIGGIGLVTGTIKPRIGMTVEKVGRTSGRTKGTIISTAFRPLRMPYPGIGDVGFEDQILISRFTEPGDSGSLVVESATKKAVGLHFASADGGSVSAPIQRVLALMGAKLAKSVG